MEYPDLAHQETLVNEFESSTAGPAHTGGSLVSSKACNTESSAPEEERLIYAEVCW